MADLWEAKRRLERQNYVTEVVVRPDSLEVIARTDMQGLRTLRALREEADRMGLNVTGMREGLERVRVFMSENESPEMY